MPGLPLADELSTKRGNVKFFKVSSRSEFYTSPCKYSSALRHDFNDPSPPPVFNGSSERRGRDRSSNRWRSLRSFLCSFLSMDPVYWFCRIYWIRRSRGISLTQFRNVKRTRNFRSSFFFFFFFFWCVAFGCNIWKTINGTLFHSENWSRASLNLTERGKLDEVQRDESVTALLRVPSIDVWNFV